MKGILLFLSASLMAQQWYQSNPDMFDIAPVTAAEAQTLDMALKVIKEPRKEIHELYQQGVLLRSVVRIYTADDWLLQEEASDAQGNIIERRSYFYDAQGIPRNVLREFPSSPEKQGQIAFYQQDEKGLSIFEIPFGAVASRTDYDVQGRVVGREEKKAEKTLRKEKTTHLADGRSEVNIAEAGGRSRKLEYQQGRKTTEEVYRNGVLEAVLVYTYDNEDRLIFITERYPAYDLETKFSYDDAGEIVQEVILRDGIILRNIEYGEGEEKTELLYREGKLFLRAVFQNETLIERVFFDEAGRPIDVRRKD